MSFKCTLDAEHLDHEGMVYRISIEDGKAGLSRMTVTCFDEETEVPLSYQGIDLTAAECRALAAMLQAASEKLQR